MSAATSTTDHVLEVSGLAVHFGGVKAVDDCSFAVTGGIVQGVIGPNGSGKSTLLGALSGLTHTTAGVIGFGGVDITSAAAEARARMGMSRTFQTVRLLPTLTLRENVQLGADVGTVGTGMTRPWLLPRWSGRQNRKSAEAAVAALDRVGIADLADRRPGELSYGHQRRVEIARAVVSDPIVVLLDEPTAGMNKSEKEQIAGILGSLRSDGITQILIDHDVEMMVGIADDIIALNRGQVLTRGRPVEVVRDPAVQEAYLGRRRHEQAAR